MHSKRIQEKVKEDYNAIAAEFSQTRHFPWKDFECFDEYFEGGRVLDLGCGNGRLLKYLEKKGFSSYLGVDQSEELLKIARKQHKGREFKLADISRLSDLDRFDALFAIASFHHIPPGDQLKTLKLWRKHLNPGGHLFMMNWNLHQPRFWRNWLCLRSSWRGLLIPWKNRVNRYYYSFTKRRLQKLLKEAGFTILENDYLDAGRHASLLKAKNIVTIATNEDL